MRRFFTGILIGTLVSYLTAPRSGKATRHQLQQLPTPIMEKLTTMVRKTQLQTRQIIQQFRANIGLSSTALNRDLDDFNSYLE